MDIYGKDRPARDRKRIELRDTSFCTDVSPWLIRREIPNGFVEYFRSLEDIDEFYSKKHFGLCASLWELILPVFLRLDIGLS